jgi:bifunctional DNA-binding transcriptional regulator/antitoxin component of YhaV-PrlF toxin-antitoxin module
MAVVPFGAEFVSTGMLTVAEDGTIQVPEEVLRAAKICPGSSIGFTIREDGEVILAVRDPDQAWFWTEEWLAGEHRVELALREGRTSRYYSDEEFVRALEDRMKDPSADV